MPEASLNPPALPNKSFLNADDVFWLPGEPSRRGVLLALRNGAALPATQLHGAAGLRPGATIKHLKLLTDAGLLTATPDGRDKRRMLYKLSPAVSVIKTATGEAMDFGCCLLVCSGTLELASVQPPPRIAKD